MSVLTNQSQIAVLLQCPLMIKLVEDLVMTSYHMTINAPTPVNSTVWSIQGTSRVVTVAQPCQVWQEVVSSCAGHTCY